VNADYDLPPPFNMCGYFDDAYSLAESGKMKTVDEVNRELLEFTRQFKELAWPQSLSNG